MKDDLLSIVVPVYNVVPYLDRSIQSLLKQTYPDMEIILVNDGSTDGSGEICEEYAKLDARIRLITQENQGAAVARRNGARIAAGRYMTFMDPDDYVDGDFYERLMALRGDLDVIIAQWLRESDSGTRRCYDTLRPGAYSTPEDMEFLLHYLINVSLPGGSVNIRPGIAAYLWNKLFRTELLQEVMEEIDTDFPNFNDDRPIIYSVMLKCRSVLVTEICGYHYCVRNDSLAHVLDQSCNYIKSVCQFYNLMGSMFAQHPKRDILIPQLQLKVAEDIARGLVRMGFPPGVQLQLRTPIFPFLNLLDGKNVALYGAGAIGCGYRRQIQKWGICRIVLWVDEDWTEYSRAGLEVSPVERLLDTTYDYVVIAFAGQDAANDIRHKLLSLGIEDSRILWKAPLEL